MSTRASAPASTVEGGYWYRGRDARPHGPLSLGQLRELWRHGGLDAHSLVWCGDWPYWKPVCLVPELSGARGLAAPSAPVPAGAARPRGNTFPPLPSLASEEEAWLRQMREMKARVRRVAAAPGWRDAADARPTLKLEAVGRSRRGVLLLAAALMGPVLLGLTLSALLVWVPAPSLPARAESLLRAVLAWPEDAPPSRVEFIFPPAARPPRFVPGPATAEGVDEVRASVWRGGWWGRAGGRVVLASETCTARCPKPAARPAFSVNSAEYEALLDKAFERELGFDAEASARARAPRPPAPRTAYVPPEPGPRTQETLSRLDILQVVSAQRESLLACVLRYAPKRAAGAEAQRVMLRLNIRPSGSVTHVQVEDKEVRGTPLAFCLQDLVRSLTFPKHRVPGTEPIRFPLVY
ncbi:GYF domain-containing protein [Melittangium boletus]|uniref:GYF domain-containing protein n=1 Tax=Melittangium boletus TaxID=83453 RepID=UPI003DA609E3